MTISSRHVQDQSDLILMASLVRTFPALNRHVVDLPYRLCSPALQDTANTRLWHDAAERLLGWAIWQAPFITLDYALHPDARTEGVEDQVLDWAIERFREVAAGKATPLGYFIDAREHDTARRGLLERHGFSPDARWQQFHLRRSLAEPIIPSSVPDRFTIRPLAGAHEAAAATALHRAAFDSENMTDDWRGRILRAAEYLPELDLVAEAPDGRLAAFCLCWLDRHDPNHIDGQIEPLGVHPDFQRQGLGRALLLEGLRRIQAAGARVAHIEVDSINDAATRLYLESGGFQIEYRALKYYRTF